MGFPVICLGAINVDLVYQVPDLSPFLEAWPGLQPGGEVALEPQEEAPLKSLLVRHGRAAGRAGGGQAANTALALARMGLPAGLVGRVGADEDGAFLKASIPGVNLDYLIQAGESGRAYILVDMAGERTILVAPNTNDDLTEADVTWEALARARFLHLTSFAGNGPFQVQTAIARRLHGGPRITLDPGELYARRGREAMQDLLDHVEALLVTEAEWTLLGGELTRRPDWAPPIVLIKRGPKGARMLNPARYRYLDFPAEPLSHLVNTLGAGDVFAAGFLAGLYFKLHLPAAVRLAVKAAAYKLAGAGRDRYPDHKFLENAIIDLH
jgi:sugar/nucleoside kinase (ribokinase family)